MNTNPIIGKTVTYIDNTSVNQIILGFCDGSYMLIESISNCELEVTHFANQTELLSELDPNRK